MKKLSPLRPLIVMAIPIALIWLGWRSVNGFRSHSSAWTAKIDPSLLLEMSTDPPEATYDFFVTLDEQADLSGALDIRDKSEKGAYVYERLEAVARRTQTELIEDLVLDVEGVEIVSYTLVNGLRIRGPYHVVEKFAQHKDVAYLHANPKVAFGKNRIDTLDSNLDIEVGDQQADLPWGIDLIDADLVWAMGITGTNVVVAGQDTGYDWDHVALKDRYRGFDGEAVDHNYSWFRCDFRGF